MRRTMIFSLLGLAGLALGGCTTSAKPEGVLPRANVPPPPSETGSVPNSTATAATTDTQSQRRSLSVPGRLVPPRPAARP
jgi:hypothetical protein